MELCEFWQPEKVDACKWMFAGDGKVKGDIEGLLKVRDDLQAKQTTIKAVLASQAAVRKNAEISWVLEKMASAGQDVEDRGCPHKLLYCIA